MALSSGICAYVVYLFFDLGSEGADLVMVLGTLAGWAGPPFLLGLHLMLGHPGASLRYYSIMAGLVLAVMLAGLAALAPLLANSSSASTYPMFAAITVGAALVFGLPITVGWYAARRRRQP